MTILPPLSAHNHIHPPAPPIASAQSAPLIQVSHLPSASSFYASLVQTLGIQFLSAAPVTPACLNYGYISTSPSGPRRTVVFSLTQSAPSSSGLNLVHVTLSAGCEDAVKGFWNKSSNLRRDLGTGNEIEKGEGGEWRARTRDFDGNVLEAVFSPALVAPHAGLGQDKVIELETASTEREARRVLQWQEKVARSIVDTGRASQATTRSDPGPALAAAGGGKSGMMRRADSYPLPVREGPGRLVRRETVATSEPYSAKPKEKEKAKEDNTDVSNGAIIGTLLGVAAVAGLARYALTRSTSPEPMPARRASAADGVGPGNHYTQQQTGVVERERIADTPRAVAVPARTIISERSRTQPAYVMYSASMPTASRELERIDERSYHSSHTARAPSHRAPSLAGRTVVSEKPRSPSREKAREIIRDDSPSRESHTSRRSHRSHRSTSHKGSPTKSRLSTSDSRSPRSHHTETAKSYHSNSPRPNHDSPRSPKSYYSSHPPPLYEREDSYTTARSQRSEASSVGSGTVKPEAPAPPPAADIVSRVGSIAGSVNGSEGGRRRRRKSSHAHSQSGASPKSYTSQHPMPSSPREDSTSYYATSGREREVRERRESGAGRDRERERERDWERERERDREPRHVPLADSVFSGGSNRTARKVPLPESVAGHSEWDRGSVRMVGGLGREYNEFAAYGHGFPPDPMASRRSRRESGGAERYEDDCYRVGDREREEGGFGMGMRGPRESGDSLAPSDSISSVGEKRERDRLRTRMGTGESRGMGTRMREGGLPGGGW